MAITNDTYTREAYVEKCAEMHWDSPEEREFFGKLYDYLQTLGTDKESDPMELDVTAVSMEAYDGRKKKDRDAVIENFRKAFAHPAYKIPQDLRDSFEKMASRKVEAEQLKKQEERQKQAQQLKAAREAMKSEDGPVKAEKPKSKHSDIRSASKTAGKLEKAAAEEIEKKAFSKTKMKTIATASYEKIKSVSFIMFKKGSPEFRAMLENLKSLDDYAKENLSGRNVSFEKIVNYYDRLHGCIKSVRDYIDYKRAQIDENNARIENADKQKREQPRINAALDVLELLEPAYEYGKAAIINRARYTLRPRLEAKLTEEDKVREEMGKPQPDNRKNYVRSVARSMYLMDSLDGNNWKLQNIVLNGRSGEETLLHFYRRTEGYVTKDVVEAGEEIIERKGYFGRSILKTVNEDCKHGKGINNEELMHRVKKVRPGYVDAHKMKELDPRAEATASREKVTHLKDTMLSQQQKNKAARAAQAAHHAPQL